MLIPRRSLAKFAFALCGGTALTACSLTRTTVISDISDAQAIVNDAADILSLGIVPLPEAAIARLVLTGFQALLATVSGALATGVSTESATVASLSSTIKSLQADVAPNTTLYNEATTALGLLSDLQANSSATKQAEIEGMVGSVLIGYLEQKAPATAMRGEKASPFRKLVGDARYHIARINVTQ